jgi:putative N6-adenine-specific DNA methylase
MLGLLQEIWKVKICRIKPSRKIKLFNASIEARLVKYEMYEGSKRTKFQTQESDSNSAISDRSDQI